MDEKIRQSRLEAEQGLAALRQGRRDIAGIYFLHALQALDDVADQKERQDHLSAISVFLLNCEFLDLALMAILDALEAGKRWPEQRHSVDDKMTYANIHARLKNIDQAESIYRSLLDYCLENRQYGNAASASTNLAGILAENTYLGEAVQLLNNSLDYLEKEAFPETESITRLTLIQILELQEAVPERIFEISRALLNRVPDLSQPSLVLLSRSLTKTLARYSLLQPAVEPNEWMKQNFPELVNI